MPLDSRRSSPKPVPSRPLQVFAEPTLRDNTPIPPAEPPVKRVLPWMGLILFCTGAVFHAGRLVERLDPQPPPSRSALLPGMLAGDVSRSAPAPVVAPPTPPTLPSEVLGKLRAEHDEAQELARQAWQKQVEAEVAAQVVRLGETSSQEQQLETDELSRKATQAASEAEAKVRALELQLATKTAELEEARLRAENAWLRAQLVQERVGPQEAEAPAKEAEVAVAAPEAEVPPEPTPPLAPTAALEPPAPPSTESSPPAAQAEPPRTPEPTAPAAEASPTL